MPHIVNTAVNVNYRHYCSICQSEVNKYEVISTNCKHHFHFNCLRHLAEHTNCSEELKCPNCRQNIDRPEVFQKFHENLMAQRKKYSSQFSTIMENTCKLLHMDSDDWPSIDVIVDDFGVPELEEIEGLLAYSQKILNKVIKYKMVTMEKRWNEIDLSSDE